jgi:hypothetical protein
VAGKVLVLAGADAEVILRFVPAAPLPAGDYVFSFASHALSVDTLDVAYLDRERVGAQFSTISRPELISSTYFSTSTNFTLGFSQPIDLESLREHLSALDELGAPIAFSAEADGELGVTVLLARPAALLSLADGALAADGTPILGLPILF